jgi:hypothetical protein
MFPCRIRFVSLLAAGTCLALFLAACKPGGRQGATAGNVFNVSPGKYSFVSGRLAAGNAAALKAGMASPPDGDAFEVKATGKHLSLSTTGASLTFTAVGKYAWSLSGRDGATPPGDAAEPINVDCTVKQDVWRARIADARDGVATFEKAGAASGFTAGCATLPAPGEENPARGKWMPVKMETRSGGGFMLLLETTVAGVKYAVSETYQRVD